MAVGYDIGVSASTSSGAQSGAASSGTGEFNVTFGNKGSGLASLLPPTPANQAWIVYAVVGLVIVLTIWLWKRRK